MDTISYSYKIGIKEEIIEALRGVFGESYPDPLYASKIDIVSEYPSKEVSYPLIVMKFNPSEVKNIGVAHYDLENGEEILHWRFQGTINFGVYALTPLDRDKVFVGLLNLFAFGKDIPAFSQFKNKIMNQRFVTLTLMTDYISESGDMAQPPAWNPTGNELLFSNSMTLDCFGEFFTTPSTGGLVEIDEIDIYPSII